MSRIFLVWFCFYTWSKTFFMAQNINVEEQRKETAALFRDDRTQKRIHEHLANEKDEITDDDIKNASTGVVTNNAGKPGIPPENPAKEEVAYEHSDIPPAEPAPGEKEQTVIKNNDDPAIETPWNILES